MIRLFCLLLAVVLALAPQPGSTHALQPAYLEMSALGEDTWRVFWKVPSVGEGGSGGMMDLTAVLPDTCDERRPATMRFDGAAYSHTWIARCPGGLTGGEILIEGLELTRTDVLIRYETSPGQIDSARATPAAPRLTIPEPQGPRAVLSTYFGLGVEHILLGTDHLLFVFALILLIPNPRMLLWSVTAFTVSHSITLALASLNIITLPGPPVEAIVALSIMILAAELVTHRRTALDLSRRLPWVMAFGFGLLHGLGFAGALREIGLPAGEVPLALLSFNLGVEAGQLLFVAAVLTSGAVFRRLASAAMAAFAGGPGLRIVSYAIGAMAGFWFVERVALF